MMPESAGERNPSQGDRHRNDEIIAEAIRHIDMGFAAFACWGTDEAGNCMCHKGGICPNKPGKHPSTINGFKDATRDPNMIRAQLTARNERINYGIVWPEGGDVVFSWDIDGEGWQKRLDDLKQVFGPLPKTKTTRTPHGGLHLYYRWPQGVSLPKGNHLHGFIVRWPMKGYVVGPGSRINGKVYTSVGTEEIATLPVPWAIAHDREDKARPLIVVEEGGEGYTLPDSVATGGRHDAIRDFVASRWNRGLTKDEVAAAVRDVLAPRFNEAMDAARLTDEIDHAWDTCEKGGWQKTFGEAVTIASVTDDGEVDEIAPGLLAPEQRSMPEAMRDDAILLSPLMTELANHFYPRTDADTTGLHVTALTYLSALVGPKPTVFYGSKQQHAAIFSVLVGSTAHGRKGTTTELVRDALTDVTESARKMKRSPNSGEGLINVAAQAKGAPLLVEEEEMSRLLVSKNREGATLSHILRQAFDGGVLTSATSTRVLIAEKHHIALLGNATPDDIERDVESIDIRNGFANRMLWIAVAKRDGHQVTRHDNSIPMQLRDDLRDVLRWTDALPAPLIGTTMTLDPAARDMLLAAGERYGQGVGMVPFLARRLDTIAARIAIVLACLDMTTVITPVHAEAALHVTDYAYASSRWLFRDTTGNEDGDMLLRYLRASPDGFLNTVEIEALIGKRAKDKQRAFDALSLMGYARPAKRPRRDGKPGKPQSGIELI